MGMTTGLVDGAIGRACFIEQQLQQLRSSCSTSSSVGSGGGEDAAAGQPTKASTSSTAITTATTSSTTSSEVVLDESKYVGLVHTLDLASWMESNLRRALEKTWLSVRKDDFEEVYHAAVKEHCRQKMVSNLAALAKGQCCEDKPVLKWTATMVLSYILNLATEPWLTDGNGHLVDAAGVRNGHCRMVFDDEEVLRHIAQTFRKEPRGHPRLLKHHMICITFLPWLLMEVMDHASVVRVGFLTTLIRLAKEERIIKGELGRLCTARVLYLLGVLAKGHEKECVREGLLEGLCSLLYWQARGELAVNVEAAACLMLEDIVRYGDSLVDQGTHRRNSYVHIILQLDCVKKMRASAHKTRKGSQLNVQQNLLDFFSRIEGEEFQRTDRMMESFDDDHQHTNHHQPHSTATLLSSYGRRGGGDKKHTANRRAKGGRTSTNTNTKTHTQQQQQQQRTNAAGGGGEGQPSEGGSPSPDGNDGSPAAASSSAASPDDGCVPSDPSLSPGNGNAADDHHQDTDGAPELSDRFQAIVAEEEDLNGHPPPERVMRSLRVETHTTVENVEEDNALNSGSKNETRCDAEREIESLKQQLAEKDAIIDNMQQTQHWSAAKVRELDMVRFESQLKDALILDKDRQIERLEKSFAHLNSDPAELSAELSSLTTESQLQDFSARLMDRQVALSETMSVISRQLPVLQSLSMQTQQSIHAVRAEEGRAAGQGQPTD
uniref:Uncharacterized protein n=1 Tax=Vitrella brassicaformis TaxID=1169539 RepID=A0A6U4BGP3_9ALVE